MLVSRTLLRTILLLALAATLFLVLARTTQLPSFYLQPGADAMGIVATLLLLAYAVAIVYVLRERFRPNHTNWFGQATDLGVIAAAIQVLHLLVERFALPPGRWGGLATLLFMLVTFLTWAAAAFRPASAGKPVKVSLLLAVWSAVVTMSLTVLVGTLLELYLAPIPLEVIRTWPEFERSGWNDLPAFAVANTIDSVISHLAIAPVVATLFGLPATGLARFRPLANVLEAKKRRL